MTSTAADHVARGASPALDLAPPGRVGRGEPIYAAKAGEVTVAASGYSEWGTYCRIEHGNGWQTGYAHCQELFVRRDEWVEAGQVIAVAGDTGKANGVHLHFEVWRDGVRVDPAPYLKER